MKPYLLALFIVFSSPAWADWKLIATTANGDEAYIDMDSLRIDKSLRRVWTLSNLKKKGSKGELSIRVLREFDCKQEQDRAVVMTGFTGAMTSGEMLSTYRGDNDPWDYIAPNTIAQDYFLMVCRK